MKRIAIVFAALAGAGCVHTQEMPLSTNMVRINTQASGTLYAGKSGPATMIAAANATLARGYSHFKIADVQAEQGRAPMSATTSGGLFFATTTVQTVNVENAGATVTMFREGDPGAKDAFDARQILDQYKDQAG